MIDINTALYNCEWMQYNKECKKIFMIFLVQTQKISNVTFLGMINVDFSLISEVRKCKC